MDGWMDGSGTGASKDARSGLLGWVVGDSLLLGGAGEDGDGDEVEVR